MSGHPPPPRRVANVGSLLLTPQENECLFGHLGRKCITLCSAVVQVFAADRSSNWVKRCCGVACLVKDNPQRSYFIRVIDIKEGKLLFEQELYNNFSINYSRSYFISFAGDNCQVGLNFASEEEAKRFRAAMADLLSRRQRKTVSASWFQEDDISHRGFLSCRGPLASMFCTAFLSAPTEECKPGGCLAPLQCLVLPEDELYSSLSASDSESRLSLHHGDHACVVMGQILLDVGVTGMLEGESGDIVGPSVTPSCSESEEVMEPRGPALPMATVDIKNPEINNLRFHNNVQVNNMVHSSFSKEKKKVKGKRKKLTKADIGTPSNFQHIGHVGWDPNTGFDLNNLDPELKNLFDMCGISEAQLKDKETSKVIYDFIEKKGGVEAVKNELRRQGRWRSAFVVPGGAHQKRSQNCVARRAMTMV
ncbi:hypothetical protein Z043_110415 [Scleropages formosus]|uniref:Neural Wiskott-Aldrich syndrome protein-like n=1 Tax=Scleropages formosus TaxID=113540 RepID=A0A0P7X8G4_SCLFO|nr:hypothetical protein Z043_110415 [Scleropages formosus]